ncbi:MAG TPA: aminopeptidase [Actinomycetes bacterium]|nr:aminopeptidase [Actinomycetes bacterium]
MPVTPAPAERLQRYAQLAVRVGANVQPGQEVFLRADLEHAPIAEAIAEEAYRAGAFRVTVEFQDARVRRSALEHAPLEALTSAPEWMLARLRELDEAGAALISLTGNADPHAFDGLPAERVSAVPLNLAQESRRVTLGGRVTWTILAAPNPGWAGAVFGEPDVERLWAAVGVAMRLDEDDVVAAWREQHRKLSGRAGALTALGLDAVRYRGEGTDLTVGLVPGCVWTGGGLTRDDGLTYMPNLPTEEVFTSPDRSRADGTIRLTRPLVMPRAGAVVEGLVVEFAGGRIVDVTADSGVDLVRAELDTDEGARSLGEVSLVDGSSRVRAAGVVFHDTLFDENAGCHVAWGQAFPFAVAGGMDKSSEQLAALGLNTSSVHTDVVVGGPGVDVDGILPDGGVVPIIVDDRWAPEFA